LPEPIDVNLPAVSMISLGRSHRRLKFVVTSFVQLLGLPQPLRDLDNRSL
jgi:hypothetical protein